MYVSEASKFDHFPNEDKWTTNVQSATSTLLKAFLKAILD